ncbi:MAG TPA: hypothetical protein IAB84_00715 [Candidatus Choladousia intestinigallinarum]|nr:hypothetical protein [Candidatus Choladousia intestinigallinarum]
MKIKRLTFSFSAMALVGIMALPVSVSAADSKTMELNAYVESTYTLTIPSKTEIVFNSTSTDLNGTLKVTGNVRPMQKVTVKAELNALHNAVQNTNLPYKLMSGAVEFQAADWSETELRAAEPKELQLSVDIAAEDWNQAKGGEYQGNIVFTAELIRE